MSDRTVPSQTSGGIPLGTPSQIRDNEDDEVKRSLERENESAITLAKAGYNNNLRSLLILIGSSSTHKRDRQKNCTQ